MSQIKVKNLEKQHGGMMLRPARRQPEAARGSQRQHDPIMCNDDVVVHMPRTSRRKSSVLVRLGAFWWGVPKKKSGWVDGANGDGGASSIKSDFVSSQSSPHMHNYDGTVSPTFPRINDKSSLLCRLWLRSWPATSLDWSGKNQHHCTYTQCCLYLTIGCRTQAGSSVPRPFLVRSSSAPRVVVAFGSSPVS